MRNKNGLRDRERRNGFGKEKNMCRINGKLFRGKERRVIRVSEHSKEKRRFRKKEIRSMEIQSTLHKLDWNPLPSSQRLLFV